MRFDFKNKRHLLILALVLLSILTVVGMSGWALTGMFSKTKSSKQASNSSLEPNENDKKPIASKEKVDRKIIKDNDKLVPSLPPSPKNKPKEKEAKGNVQTVLKTDPKVEELLSHPKVEEPLSHPKVEELLSHPKVEELLSHPKVEEPLFDPKVEEPLFNPKVEELLSHPKVEEPLFDPKVEELLSHPKVEEPLSHPKVEEPLPDPKVEEPGQWKPLQGTIITHDTLGQIIVKYGEASTNKKDLFKYTHGTYFTVFSQETFAKIQELRQNPDNCKAIRANSSTITTDADVTQALFNSRLPVIYAEGSLSFITANWTKDEQRVLGETAVITHCLAFDSARWYEFEQHAQPQPVTLGFVSGAIRRQGFVDYDDLKSGTITLKELYARRLVPVFAAFSKIVTAIKSDGRGLVVTGSIGCGQFAENPQTATSEFHEAFRQILDQYRASHFPNLDFRLGYTPGLTLSTKSDDWSARRLFVEKESIGHLITLTEHQDRMRSLTGDAEINYVHLFSLVAWDPFSLNGNDWLAASRSTDDGYKGASTDTIGVVMGVEGSYKLGVDIEFGGFSLSKTGYYPPDDEDQWSEYVNHKNLKMNMRGRMFVYDKESENSELISVL